MKGPGGAKKSKQGWENDIQQVWSRMEGRGLRKHFLVDND